jgi:hypothetical protein
LAKRPTLTDITSFTNSSNINSINQNWGAIEEAFDNTISRDGSTPNTMDADLDLNGNDLLNVGNLGVDTITLAGVPVVDVASVPDWRGEWVTATTYKVLDVVRRSGSLYICLVEHIADVFATDLSAAKWEVFIENTTGPSGVGVPTGGTVGQVLVKTSGVDYGTGWATAQSFDTRAALVSANTTTPGLGLSNGQILVANGLEYRRLSSSTAISDLAGWVPNGRVTPQHFGDNTTPGTTDITTPIQAAATYLASVGGGTLWLEAARGPYAFSALDLSGGVSLEGDNAVVVPLNQTLGNLIVVNGTRGADESLTVNAAPGATTLTVASTAGWAAGDWLDLLDNLSYTTTDANYKNGERLRVLEVTSGTVLTLYGPVMGTIAGGSYTTGNSAKINKITLAKPSAVRGIKFQGDWDSLRRLVFMGLVDSPIIENCIVNDHGTIAFRLNGCVFGTIRNNTINRLRDDIGGGFSGYGIVLSGCDLGATIQGNMTSFTRHGFTTLGGLTGFPRGFLVDGNTDSYSTVASFDTHAAGSDYRMTNNVSVGAGGAGITVRAPNGVIADNLISRAVGQGISIVEENLRNIEVRDNTLFNIGGIGISAGDPCPELSILYNRINRCGNRAIRCFPSTTSLSAGLRIIGNIIESPSLTASVEAITTEGSVTNSGAIIRENSIFQGSGTPTYAIRTLSLDTSTVSENFASGTFSTAAYSTGTNINEENRTAGAPHPVGWNGGHGVGGTVTQVTNKSTAVTLDKMSGVITTNSAALAAGASVVFTLNNSEIAFTNVVIASIRSPVDKYTIDVIGTTAGTAQLRLTNITGGSLSEAVLINFAVIRAVTN